MTGSDATAPDHHWPDGSVRAVLATDLVTPATRAALAARLLAVAPFTPVLDAAAAGLLAAVCDRLVPQPDRAEPIDIAGELHRKLASGGGNGWRFDSMPGDVAAMRAGLAAIDASAGAMFGGAFSTLTVEQRDAVLLAVQSGTAPGAGWTRLDPARFFEELLAGVAESYWSHPLAQEEIGYLGMADAQGWATVGLGARAAFEPVEL